MVMESTKIQHPVVASGEDLYAALQFNRGAGKQASTKSVKIKPNCILLLGILLS